MNDACPSRRPARWALILAFTAVCLSWGTTYLAIKEGVRHLPPMLFGGSRLVLAGLILLAFLAVRGRPLRLPRDEAGWVALTGVLMFVGGNGLLALAERTLDSGPASVLVATTPLWIAVLELGWPGGERLGPRGWLGLLVGLGGVLVLLAPRLHGSDNLLHDAGVLFLIGSTVCWALGSVVLRHRRARSHLAGAAYQMALGGGVQVLVGLTLGEGAALTPESFTPGAVYAFFHLLVVGSLIGFVAYNWLLGHVSAALAGTHAYINPLVAVAVAALWGEHITGWIVAGMAVILAGVFLVRTGGTEPTPVVEPAPAEEPEDCVSFSSR